MEYEFGARRWIGGAQPLRLRRPEHLKSLAAKPCLICGRRPSEAHHLTFAQPRGMAIKSSDAYTVLPARAGWRIDRHWSLSLTLDNLTGREYFASTRQPGRTVYAELSWRM